MRPRGRRHPALNRRRARLARNRGIPDRKTLSKIERDAREAEQASLATQPPDFITEHMSEWSEWRRQSNPAKSNGCSGKPGKVAALNRKGFLGFWKTRKEAQFPPC